MSLLEISLWNFTRPVPARQRHEVPGVKTTLRGLNQFDLGGRKGQFSDGAPSSGPQGWPTHPQVQESEQSRACTVKKARLEIIAGMHCY